MTNHPFYSNVEVWFEWKIGLCLGHPGANYFGIYKCMPLGHILINYFKKFFIEKRKNNLLF